MSPTITPYCCLRILLCYLYLVALHSTISLNNGIVTLIIWLYFVFIRKLIITNRRVVWLSSFLLSGIFQLLYQWCLRTTSISVSGPWFKCTIHIGGEGGAFCTCETVLHHFELKNISSMKINFQSYAVSDFSYNSEFWLHWIPQISTLVLLNFFSQMRCLHVFEGGAIGVDLYYRDIIMQITKQANSKNYR